MADFAILRHEEPIRFDRDRLETLYCQLGPDGAEKVVCRAVEELAVRLAELAPLHGACRLAELSRRAHSLIAIAEQIGLGTLAAVASDVAYCSTINDPTALAATLCRLERIGEQSQNAFWEIQNMTV